MIDSLRKIESDKTFLIDGGNNFSFASDIDVKKKYIEKYLDYAKYDAIALGVEELKIGLENINLENYPYFLGNINLSENAENKPKYHILKYKGLKIGIYNLLSKDYFKNSTSKIDELIYDSTSAIQDDIDELNKKCDYLIVILQGTDGFYQKYLEKLNNVDLYFTAINRRIYADITEKGKKPYYVVSNGSKGEYIGLLKLDFFEDKLLSSDYSVYILSDRVDEHSEMQKIVNDYKMEKNRRKY